MSLISDLQKSPLKLKRIKKKKNDNNNQVQLFRRLFL